MPLRLIDSETGAVVTATENVLLERIESLEVDLSRAERDLRSKRRQLAAYEKDHQAEAEAHGLWPFASRMFRWWQAMLDHPRSEWTWQRFELVLPFLVGRKYGPEACLRAIAGRKADLWYVKRGLTSWEDIFGDQGKLEKCLAQCPSDWKVPRGALECLPNRAPRKT